MVRAAVTHVAGVMAFAVVFVVAGAVLYDPVPLWVVIVFPLLVLAGAIGALWRTYRLWQAHGRWQVWQGASWFLLAMFLITLGGTGGVLLDR